ncbi:hypothetical protein [Caballeronia grimmiae]|uniref:hypothetical protein n=1 Tax=Caballeronia grimmiae TaxID=1071679 RepID=UPI0038B7C042
MSDDEVLEITDGAAAKANGLRLLKAAKASAAKGRLAAAKEAVASARRKDLTTVEDIGIEDIRAYIRQASNDGQYTLAARNLEEMTEADLRRLYSQLKRLESSPKPGEEDEDESR